MNEIWRPTVELGYEVSNLGRVRSLDRPIERKGKGVRLYKGCILTPIMDKYGYLRVSMGRKAYQIHRLVGMAFPDMVDWTENTKGKPFDELQINHKDENKENNRVDNLEWCLGKYNMNYGTRTSRVTKKRSKTVYMYTLDGGLCGMFSSTAEAGKVTNSSRGNITMTCLGIRQQCKGYKWSYEPPKLPKALPHYVGVLPCGPASQGN